MRQQPTTARNFGFKGHCTKAVTVYRKVAPPFPGGLLSDAELIRLPGQKGRPRAPLALVTSELTDLPGG